MQLSLAWLQLLGFFAPDIVDSPAATDAIVEAILGAPIVSLGAAGTILTMGSPTNVARAIEQFENEGRLDTHTNLKHVYMMGGEHTKGRLDLNFLTRRSAARTIIVATTIPLTLIPIQLCAQVTVERTFVQLFDEEYCL
jgi:inosine-uridine nucleoside N-ribohydrolase